MSDVSELIGGLRNSLKLTLKQMAERTGLSVAYLSDLEHGRSQGSIETFKRIADGVGVKFVMRFENEDGQDVALAQARKKLNTFARIMAFMKELEDDKKNEE